MNNTPLDIVNARMKAHNAHDLDSFLSLYAADVAIYGYPDSQFGEPGHAHLTGIFAPLFAAKAVHTTIHHQIENGRYVVNHETVVREGETTIYVSIYEVKDGLIKTVRFITDK